MPVQGQESFTLTVKNPCIDPAYVTIGTTALPTGKSYTLYMFDPVAKYEFSHDAFAINASPAALAICGDLTYIANFEGTLIDEITEPMAYT